MRKLELKMVEILKKLKDKYDVAEIKAEFETEATRMDELMRLKEITEKAGLGLVLKIGGAEAVTDMFNGQLIGVSGIVAPMIESSYSMLKYLEAIEKHFDKDLKENLHFGANIETFLAYKNLDNILKLKNIQLLKSLTLGRTDMCGSLGLSKRDINTDQIYKIAEDMFLKIKKKDFKTKMGGGMSPESIPFLKKLSQKKLLDFFETRKVIFKIPKNFKKTAEGILLANEFEVLWLESKRDYYEKIYYEDVVRIKELRRRMKK